MYTDTLAHSIVEEYRQYLLADGKAQKTVVSYVGDVVAFIRWTESKGAIFGGSLTRYHVTSYRNHLIESDCAVNTINKKINSLHAFGNWLVETERSTTNAVNPAKDKVKVANGSECEVEVFTEPEVERLLFYLEDRKQVSMRDRTTIILLLFTGVRVSELVGIKLKDLDLVALQLKVIGKGVKTREIPLKVEVAEAIKEYLNTERKENKNASSEYLFLTQRAGKMDKDTVNKLLRKHGKNLGMVMKPHKFRHTFCTRLLKKGVEITTVSKLAGHASIQTTSAFYINTSRQDKITAVNLL